MSGQEGSPHAVSFIACNADVPTPLQSASNSTSSGQVWRGKQTQFEHYTFSNGQFYPVSSPAHQLEGVDNVKQENHSSSACIFPVDSPPGDIVEVKTEGSLPEWEHNYNKACSSPALVIQFEEPNNEVKQEVEMYSCQSVMNDVKNVSSNQIVHPVSVGEGIKVETMAPEEVSSGKKVKTLRKTIVVPPGADVEVVTKNAIASITAELNKRAAERLAHGRNVADEEETVVEITRIAPGEGYFSRENVVRNTLSYETVTGGQLKQSKYEESLQEETTPPPLHIISQCITPSKLERTPSPAVQYFGEVRDGRLTPELASSKSAVHFTAMKTLQHTPPASSSVSISVTNTATGLMKQNGTSSITRASLVKPITLHIEPLPSAVAAGVMPSTSGINTAVEHVEQPKEKLDSCLHDDSLTNIQWLGKMSGEKLQSSERNICILTSEKQIEKVSRECGRKKRPPYSYMHLIQMAISSKPDKRMTLRQIYKWIEEKFPYYKFSAKPGWKNSIRHNLSLYDIFMRQKSTTPGHTGCSYWTLRHDVDPKSSKIFKCASSGTNTALRTESAASKTVVSAPKSSIQSQSQSQASPQIMWVNSNSQDGLSSVQKLTHKHRKGPAPLLPKLPTMQTYALIPIQSGVPVLQSQQLMLQSWPVGSSTAPTATIVNSTNSSASSQSADTSLNRSGTKRSGPMVLNGPQRKQVKIAPKAITSSISATLGSSGQVRSCSPVTMASSLLLHSSHHSTSSLAGNNSAMISMDTTDLNHQMSNIQMDSGIDTKSSSELSISDPPSSQERPKLQMGLPRPKLYRHKKPRKEVHKIRPDDKSPESLNGSNEKKLKVLSVTDSSIPEANMQDLLASIQKEFSSPMKSLLRTPPKAMDKVRLTSTPTKGTPDSPSSWLSPIRGLTPLSTDGNFLDSGIFTPEDKLPVRQQGEFTPGSKGSCSKSPRLGSLRDFGLPGLTPLKSPGKLCLGQSPNGSINLDNQSFTRLLGEFHLDSMVEEMGVDVANLSWSAFNGGNDS